MKSVKIIKYVFSAIGIGLLLGAGALYQHTSAFVARASSTSGVVVELVESRSSDSVTWKPRVSYSDAHGRVTQFTSPTSSNPPSYEAGETVEVLYVPGEPDSAEINGFFSLWGGTLILSILGAVFGLTGAGIWMVQWMTARRHAVLKQAGIRISTQLQSVELNRSLEVNGRHPFRIVSQWHNPATGKIHVFNSENLWFDPTAYIKSGSVDVLIERDNPARYLVDTSFLPALAD